jgi:hypothetical protein
MDVGSALYGMSDEFALTVGGRQAQSSRAAPHYDKLNLYLRSWNYQFAGACPNAG